MGNTKVSKLQRIVPFSDMCITGRGIVLAGSAETVESEAVCISLSRTGELLVINNFKTRKSRELLERRMMSASGKSKSSSVEGASSLLDADEGAPG